ncbi:hypothetical protein LVD13_11870 [Flavobacteriaceae bacterium D16]|nr:hypothetical protein [Flavobacteriaceae bacterium D16]
MKKTGRLRLLLKFIAISILFFTTSLSGQYKENITKEFLSDFSRLIGGEWHLGNSYQVFEWGVGKLSVKSSNYFITDGIPELVSEGLWIWHPGEKQIKGYFTAVNMPADFFEYTTFFQENTMINRLTTYSSNDRPKNYTEIWEFKDDKTFKWTLFQKKDGKDQLIMEGTYQRKLKNE